MLSPARTALDACSRGSRRTPDDFPRDDGTTESLRWAAQRQVLRSAADALESYAAYLDRTICIGRTRGQELPAVVRAPQSALALRYGDLQRARATDNELYERARWLRAFAGSSGDLQALELAAWADAVETAWQVLAP